MLSRSHQFQKGLTLVELMISIALSLIVVGGVLYVTASTMRTNAQTLRSTHLNQELRAAMQMITRDLRRSGYRYGSEMASIYSASRSLTLSATSGTITITPPTGFPMGSWIIGARIRHASPETGLSYCIDITSPTSGSSFTSATGTYVDCEASSNPTAFPSTTIAAGTWTVEDPNGAIKTTASCISFGYDHDEVGGNDTGDGDIATAEQIGYRFDATNNAIEMKSSSADCATGTWTSTEDIISPSVSGVRITGFSVTKTGEHQISSGNVDVLVLELQLALTGQLTSDSTVTRTITESVKVRNDQLI